MAAVSDAPWSRFSAADYDLRQWTRACLIDTGEGEPDSKDRYKLPVKEPGGAVNRGGAHAAAGVLAGARGGVQASEEQKRAAARKLLAIYRDDLDEEPPESLMTMAGMSTSANRAGEPVVYRRWYALEDIRILRSGEGGDGRTVEAYAAVFNSPVRIVDPQGEYEEDIVQTAFNRALDHARRGRDGWNVRVLYNHGYTVQGTPSERFSIPIGTPVDIRPESRGLLTLTRYSDTPLAEEILEAIRSGSVTSQSFSGRIVRSDPELKPGQRHRPAGGRLTRVRRLELGLREYGPTPFPAYQDAEVLGVRMSTPLYDSDSGDEATRTADPDGSTETPGTVSHEAPAADDPPAEGEHSIEHHQHRLWVLRMQEMCRERGIPL